MIAEYKRRFYADKPSILPRTERDGERERERWSGKGDSEPSRELWERVVKVKGSSRGRKNYGSPTWMPFSASWQ